MYVLTPISNKINPMQQHKKKSSLSRGKKIFHSWDMVNIITSFTTFEAKRSNNKRTPNKPKMAHDTFFLFFNKTKTKSSLFLHSWQPTNKPKKASLALFSPPFSQPFFFHQMTNPFLLFLGGFYSQRRGSSRGCQ